MNRIYCDKCKKELWDNPTNDTFVLRIQAIDGRMIRFDRRGGTDLCRECLINLGIYIGASVLEIGDERIALDYQGAQKEKPEADDE